MKYSNFTISLLTFDQFWWNFTWQGISAFPSWWVTKSLRILKSKLTDGGQLENWEKFQFPSTLYPKTTWTITNKCFHTKLVKYSNFYDIFADVWPILMKFCMMTHISYTEHNSCLKDKCKQNTRWWTLPFKKLSNVLTQQLFHWFLIKIW